MKSSSTGFIRGVEANIAFWQSKLGVLSDENILALRVEHQNLVTAVQFGLVLPETQKAAGYLILQAFNLVERCGYWMQWIPLYERAIESASCDDVETTCTLCKRLGQLFRFNGQLAEAITIHAREKQLAETTDSPQAVADAHLNLSEDFRLKREYDMAESHGQKALVAFRTLPEMERWLIAALNTLGLIAYEVGIYDVAESRLQEAVSRGRKIEGPTYLARMCKNLALVLQAQKDFDAAMAYYQEAKELLAGTASELDRVTLQLSIGSLFFSLDQLDEAEQAFRQADSLALRQSGDMYLQAVLGQNLGNVLLKQRQFDEAEKHLGRSMILWEQIGHNIMLANTTGTLAELMAVYGRLPEAKAYYDEALELLDGYPDIAWARELQKEFREERFALGER